MILCFEEYRAQEVRYIKNYAVVVYTRVSLPLGHGPLVGHRVPSDGHCSLPEKMIKNGEGSVSTIIL